MQEQPLYGYRAEGWEKKIYGMPAFTILLVSDIRASSAWYQTALGFADVFTMRDASGTPLLAHLRWCLYGDVLLRSATTPLSEDRGEGILLNFAVEDVDALASRAREHGANILSGPINRPWNARDVTIADPDGYRLNFTGQLPAGVARAAMPFD